MENPREQRGLMLAATAKIRRYGERWMVPSQTGNGVYMVRIAREKQCTCPDWETRRGDCKHIFAALFVMRREENTDGSTTVTETIAVTTETRRTYPQAWSAYNTAQTHEKDKFQVLLFDLCRDLRTQIK